MSDRMGGPAYAGQIHFPADWLAGRDWSLGPDVVLTSDDEKAIAAGGVLDDGTNLMGLCWPGGQRVYRTSPDTDWAFEERFEGDAPPRIQDVWRIIIDCAVKGARDAWDELGGRPS